MQKLIEAVFGASWKSSLIGLVSALILAGAAYAEGRSEPGWYVVAFALAALGRAVKDSGVTGGTVIAPNATVVGRAISAEPPKA